MNDDDKKDIEERRKAFFKGVPPEVMAEIEAFRNTPPAPDTDDRASGDKFLMPVFVKSSEYVPIEELLRRADENEREARRATGDKRSDNDKDDKKDERSGTDK